MTTALHVKFISALNAAKAQFVERDHIIDGLGACMLSGQHALMIGPPGTAKSALARAVSLIIADSSFFQWLLTRFTPPEELQGPISLAGLEKDVFRRVTTGKLPEADIAFLDEIFKANSAILNALLTMLNERFFYNNGTPQPIPLISCIGASNEYPDGPELGALYDRFLVKWYVEPISDRDNLRRMLSSSEPGSIAEGDKLTRAELEQARQEVTQVTFGQDALTMLLDIKDACAKNGILASDRRWRQASRYLRGVAWMDGKAQVEEEHFMALGDVLWREHKERPAIMQTIGKVSNPSLVSAMELYDAIAEQFREAARKPDEEAFAWSVRVGKSYQEIGKIMKRLQGVADANPGKTKIAEYLAQAKKMEVDLRQEALKSAGMA